MGRGQAPDTSATVQRQSAASKRRDEEIAQAEAAYEQAIAPAKERLNTHRLQIEKQGLTGEAYADAIRSLEEDFSWEIMDATQVRDAAIAGANMRYRQTVLERSDSTKSWHLKGSPDLFLN